ncbi:MAG: Holliday junction resolvase RuvX [Candidatus Eisenbacteria bacterium]|nr:Holliday junction resolvase RuvX [Candidatus Eisenbacteria bacterium]
MMPIFPGARSGRDVSSPPDSSARTPGPFLGIDAGSRRSGLATSDAEGRLAAPVSVVAAAGGRLESELARAARERGVAGVVLGWPLNMDGSEGAQARKVRRLGRRLARLLGVPVWLWDERLTSWDAGQHAGRRRRRDDIAATLILQAFLDEAGWRRRPDYLPPDGVPQSAGDESPAGRAPAPEERSDRRSASDAGTGPADPPEEPAE